MAHQGHEASDEDSDDDLENVYNPVIYDGTLPAAVGSVATLLGATTNAVHRNRAVSFYNFLWDEEHHMIELNSDNTPLTALIYIPNTKMV